MESPETPRYAGLYRRWGRRFGEHSRFVIVVGTIFLIVVAGLFVAVVLMMNRKQ